VSALCWPDAKTSALGKNLQWGRARRRPTFEVIKSNIEVQRIMAQHLPLHALVWNPQGTRAACGCGAMRSDSGIYLAEGDPNCKLSDVSGTSPQLRFHHFSQRSYRFPVSLSCLPLVLIHLLSL
jgi:hypothetical protein